MTEQTPEGPDEIKAEDFQELDSFLPGEAGRIIRRVMRKCAKLEAAVAANVQGIQALNQARQAQADEIRDLKARVRALEQPAP